MPHVIVEHSSDIDAKPLLPVLHDLVSSFETVKPEAVKTRAEMYRFHTVAGDDMTSFIHIEFRLMEGRSPEMKSSFRDALFAKAKVFGENTGASVAVSVHISELSKDFYRTELIK